PRLTLPPVPGPENFPVAPAPEVARAPEKSEELPVKAADGKKGEEQRARSLLDGKSNAKPAAGEKGARFAVQVAAPASETAARDLAERLKKSGLAPYTEKVETKQGARYRVRLGPYASRDEADGVRTRLKAQGISANLVTL
ncbi:MAG TPA: SPOR domain-containing protein, partial [Burkholderiaceae bacterium]|nr:SPOR domain-containing protein [Burkholderiaceae bacterium]